MQGNGNAQVARADEVLPARISLDKPSFVALGRAMFSPSERQPCCICGRHISLTHAHHVVPLAIQFDRGFATPSGEHEWLCPTHHAAVHVLIGQSKAVAGRASRACIGVVNDLAEEGIDTLRKAIDLCERAWK